MVEDLPEEGEGSRELQSGTVDNFLGATSWEWVPSFVPHRGLRWGWGSRGAWAEAGITRIKFLLQLLPWPSTLSSAHICLGPRGQRELPGENQIPIPLGVTATCKVFTCPRGPTVRCQLKCCPRKFPSSAVSRSSLIIRDIDPPGLHQITTTLTGY